MNYKKNRNNKKDKIY